jgi:hypothetical protein
MTNPLPAHLAAMQRVFDQMLDRLSGPVRDAEPRKPYSCHACRDSGDTEYGRPCGWCALGHGPDDTDDEPTAAEVERLRAIEREFMR